ncbi:MAG TPA: STAS domain-containing protein [Ideonella sp.]|nr:STAS domain-containing protein [Ideonella sp.]
MLPEVLTLREARASLRMLAQALQREGTAQPVTIDASALRQFDSAALAVLLECQRLARSFGRAFEVRGAPTKLAGLAHLYGIEPLLLPA